METLYALNTPYPEISPCVAPRDARLLQENYGGRESETTAILQYMFQHYLTSKTPSESFYRMIEGIAVTEMHHHELLGKAIVACGGTPLIGGNHCFWSGSDICYVKDLKQMLQADIAGEEQAIAGYRRTAAIAQNPQIRALVSRIIQDEELHLSLFRAELNRLG